MKNFTITFLFILSLFFVSNNLFAQIPANAVNADPSVTEVILEPLSATINGTAVMRIGVENATGDPVNGIIPIGSINVNVVFPAQYGIATVPVVTGYSVTSFQLGPSGFINFVNTATIAFNERLDPVFTVTGYAVGGGTTTATVTQRVPVTTANTQTGNDQAFSIFIVGTVLPLKLLSFAAKENNCAAVLNWKTAEEQNTAYFIVEQSKDGIVFNSLGSVTAQGNGSGKTYAYTAAHAEGLSYYRLKMMDTDGRFTYSPIVSVSMNCAGKGEYISVYPNLLMAGNDELTISYKLPYSGKAQIWISNNIGQRFMSKAVTFTAGSNVIKMNTHSLVAGSYYLNIIDGNGNSLGSVQKIIKQ